jgi:hypothetical protein
MKNLKSGTSVLAALVLVIGTSLGAFADDSNPATATDTGQAKATSNDTSETKSKVGDVAPGGGNTTPGAEAVDQEITNNYLRALSGSLSRWSIASQFDYLGGTVNSPLSQDRPDVSGASGNTLKSDLDGNISAKYNLNAKDSLMTGIGIRWIAPLTPGGPTNYSGTTFDAVNPYVQYQHIYKIMGIQSVMQLQLMQWTQQDFVAYGYGQQLQFDQEMAYAIPHTKLSIGASAIAQYQTFNKTGSYGDPSNQATYIPDLTAVQSQYAMGLYPLLEYQITPKINFRTLTSLWVYEHYMNFQGPFALVRDNIYQSIGIGFSITRDIFLYPNVQFLPLQASADLTNVGITATINLF